MIRQATGPVKRNPANLALINAGRSMAGRMFQQILLVNKQVPAHTTGMRPVDSVAHQMIVEVGAALKEFSAYVAL